MGRYIAFSKFQAVTGVFWSFGYYACIAVPCILVLSSVAYSQSTFGTMLGTVKDPSGSLIPGATVTIEQRHQRQRTASRTRTERTSSSTSRSGTTNSRWKRRGFKRLNTRRSTDRAADRAR